MPLCTGLELFMLAGGWDTLNWHSGNKPGASLAIESCRSGPPSLSPRHSCSGKTGGFCFTKWNLHVFYIEFICYMERKISYTPTMSYLIIKYGIDYYYCILNRAFFEELSQKGSGLSDVLVHGDFHEISLVL